MAIAATLGKQVQYVLESDRELPETEQTKFTLRAGLSREVTAIISNKMMGLDPKGQVAQLQTGTMLLEACRRGIAGWENFKDEDGEEVRCRLMRTQAGGKGAKMLTTASVNRLQQEHIEELGEQICDLNGIHLIKDEDDDDEIQNDPNQEDDDDDHKDDDDGRRVHPLGMTPGSK